ncbi:MAG: large repetitive protein [Acidobacteriota bacterium]|jgi:chitinase|nr:large repetitive protein [Acidobacteriota bacterium]
MAFVGLPLRHSQCASSGRNDVRRRTQAGVTNVTLWCVPGLNERQPAAAELSSGEMRPLAQRFVGELAPAGVDFKTTSGTLTSQPFGLTRILIPLIADTTAEGDETFTLVLSNVRGAKLARSAATIVILDDDGEARLPVLSVAPVVAAESNSSSATFHVVLSFPAASDVRFRAQTIAGSASDTTDFRPLDNVFTIRAGYTDTYVNVGLRESSDTEPVETFTLVLSEPVGATVATPTVTGTILDTDPNGIDPSAATLVVNSTTVVEGNGGFTTARFKVDLSRPLSTPATVQWTTADGSATAPGDYIAASGTLTFAPGETSKNIDVRVIGDPQFENDENFTLVLGNAVNARVSGAAAPCLITNDDAPIDRRRSTGH